MKKHILLFFLFCFNLYALIPSPESLLRNNNNGFIADKYTSIAFQVKAIDLSGKVEAETYFKFLFENGDPKRASLLQTEFESLQMEESKVVEARSFSSLDKIVLSDKSPARKLFYSLMHSLGTNDASIFARSLRSLDSSFPLNAEILNQEKLRLLENQKRYLYSVKRDTSLKEKSFSPLNPESEEERAKVQELLRQSTYKDTGLVSLEKVQDRYYFALKTNLVSGLFSAIDYRLHKLEVKHEEEVYSFENTNYILFDGTHEYPKLIKIVGSNNRAFLLQIVQVAHFNLPKVDFAAKAQSLSKSSKSKGRNALFDELFY